MRITQLLVLAAVAAMAFPALAQDRAPDWLKMPTARDLAAVWPTAMLKKGEGGKAIIACTVTVLGTLRACRMESESPAGSGFGSAALALSSQFLMKPALKGGVAVEAPVRIPIGFPRPDRMTGSHLKPVTDADDVVRHRVYTRLPWIKAPTAAEVLAAYPAKARAEKIDGTAVLDCRIDKDGGISACRTLKEQPEHFGFGQAARSLSDRFEGPMVNSQGASMAGDHVHLRIGFAAASLESAALAIGHPEWTALPSMSDFTAVLPAAARKAQVYRARVVMLCTVGAGGGLEACKAQSEEPAGLGYAEAALSLSTAFRLAVWTEEGLPTVGGSVRVPLRFDMDEAMRGAPKP